ncbi:TolB family protein [Melittangium boletus]|nr:PD40 domain-containing protein [Melittangium boletus]
MAVATLSGCTCGGADPTPGTLDSGTGGGNGNDAGSGTGDGRDGGDTSPDGGITLDSLSISPPNPILKASGSTAATQKFSVLGIYSDGHSEDLTSQAFFSIEDTRLGTFSGPTFTSSTTVGGKSAVHARVDTLSISTELLLQLSQKTADPAPGSADVPANADSKFGGTVDPARKPSLVYPADKVMVPPNLGQLEIHFTPGPTTNTLFELRFTNDITDVRVYLRCYLPSGVTLPTGITRGCIYTPDETVWKFLAESNRGGQLVTLALRATDDAGTSVGVSDPISLQFARAEIKGALYYWTTKPDQVGVTRYDFAGTGPQTATSMLTKNNINTSGVGCVGCHSLSRNGKKLVAAVEGDPTLGRNEGQLALIKDLSTYTPDGDGGTPSDAGIALTSKYQSAFESWNPDGSKFVGVYSAEQATKFGLLLFNGDTGAFESQIANTGTSQNPATHPDWSADGKTIAYTSVGYTGYPPQNRRTFTGSIQMVRETAGSWSAPLTVVPPVPLTGSNPYAKHRYYPAIAPDNAFLVFNESTCPINSDTSQDCNGDTDPTATLWAAKLEANAALVELKNANKPGITDDKDGAGAYLQTLTNSYPKWSPFVTQGNTGDTSRLMWLTFSSSRNYGLRKTADASNASEARKSTLLWMAAVDPDKVLAGEDGSYVAFALPFQDITTSNHIAQWAQYLVSNGCSTVDEGCDSAGATCCNGLKCVQLNRDPPLPCDIEGACACKPIPQCAPAFQKCSTVAPCCDGLRCLDDTTGGDCSGDNCSCRPPCSGKDQPCGGGSACCNGLTCTTTSSGNVCRVKLN